MSEELSRQVDLPELEERYFERMASSFGDKARLLNYLPPVEDPSNPPRILDIGAGGGEFSNALSELGYDVTALDASDDAVMRIRKKYPHITTATLLANHVNELGAEVFDVIICSSVLHEVVSYGDDVHKIGHISSLSRALQAFNFALKSGGRLLIRDGVLPDNWREHGTIELLEGHDPEAVYEYLRMCPFANGQAYGNIGTLVSLQQTGAKNFSGNVRSLLEFAYTYTWGVESYFRETQELYAVMTLDDYANFLEEHGFEVTEKFAYLQEGYPANLNKKMRLQVDDRVNEWFNSNAIWVAVKPS